VGAVFSILATFQAAVPLVASPVFGFTYRVTLDTFPGAFLILTAVLSIICCFMMLYVTWGLKTADRMRKLDETKYKKETLALVTLD
jgi:hypothetical protein